MKVLNAKYKARLVKKPEITKDKLVIYPFLEQDCVLCQLDLDDLQETYDMWIAAKKRKNKDLSLGDFTKYLKDTFGIGVTTQQRDDHFTQHMLTHHDARSLSRVEDSDLVRVMAEADKKKDIAVKEQIETAFNALVSMSKESVETTKKINDSFNTALSGHDLIEDFKKQIQREGALDSLKKINKLLKDNREQIQALSAIRAPKVVLSNYMNNFVTSIIKDTVEILVEVFSLILEEANKKSEYGYNIDMTALDPVMRDCFQIGAQNFKKRMANLSTRMMKEAEEALKNMEQII